MSYNLFNLFKFCYYALNRKHTVLRANYNGQKYESILEYNKSYFIFNLIMAELDEITPII